MALYAFWAVRQREALLLEQSEADERGSIEYNRALGQRRSEAAKRYLVSLGVAEGRIRTVSYGKERPLMAVGGESAWSQNRRAEFLADNPDAVAVVGAETSEEVADGGA